METSNELAEVFAEKFASRDPRVSYQAIADWIRDEYHERITDQTVGAYHSKPPKRLDPFIVGAIAAFYGLGLADLPMAARERCARTERVLVLIDGGKAGLDNAGGSRVTSRRSGSRGSVGRGGRPRPGHARAA